MATCKDCLHVDVCCSYLSTVYNKCKLATPDFELLKNIECDECQHFKDRSRFVELPCDIISKAEIKRELSAQCAVKKIDVETAKDMLENLPYIRVNTKQELKERENNAN